MKFQNSNNRSYQATTNKDGADIPDATSQVNIEERILSFYGGISKQINERISLEASVEAEAIPFSTMEQMAYLSHT